MIHHNIVYYIRYRKKTGKKGLACIKKVCHDVIEEFVGGLYELLCKIHIFKPKIIAEIDGGICSQMFQFLVAQVCAKTGEIVGYDLDWYRTNGMDGNKKYARVFELEEMFPEIKIQKYVKLTIWFYKIFLLYSSDDHILPNRGGNSVAPIYLGGYYDMDDEVFAKSFKYFFCDNKAVNIPYELVVSNVDQLKCAVHVRRGDLVGVDSKDYLFVSDEYFFKAIDYVKSNYKNIKFFFFSDEIKYVKDNIVPNLDVEYEIIDGNHKAYEDLLLISTCDVVISSQGSYGKFASMFNEDTLLIMQDDRFAHKWLVRHKNSIVI